MSMLWTPNLKTVVLILQMRTVGPREVKHHPRSVTLKGQNQAQHWKSDPRACEPCPFLNSPLTKGKETQEVAGFCVMPLTLTTLCGAEKMLESMRSGRW